MKKYYDILRKNTLFSGADGDIGEILKCLKATVKKYRQGQIALLEGDAADALGIVAEGGMLIAKEDAEGNRVILAEAAEGEMFQEAIACAQKKSPVTVTAAYDSAVVYIRIKDITANCPFSARISQNLLRIMAEKNLYLNKRIDILTRKSLREKLDMFFELQREQFGSKFTIPFSRGELAEFIFANRSAVSRELCAMRDEGILKFDKNRFEIIKN